MTPERFDAAGLRTAGFAGFVSIRELRNDRSRIPAVRGVYALLRCSATGPAFLPVGTGGRFKGKDPNVDLTELQRNWVRGASVVYIGKAGDPGRAATLRSRLTQYPQVRRRDERRPLGRKIRLAAL